MTIPFPVPRITEGFIDKIVESMGGHRLTDQEKNYENDKNADYLLQDTVAELKLLEEEGLEKTERQKKIAEELSKKYILPETVDVDIKRMSDNAKADYRQLIGIPIKKAVRKAAKQIKATKTHLGKHLDSGLLIAVNNGFNSLPHDEFDNLVLSHCRQSTSQIDFLLCTTIEYHQGGYDSYVFCCSNGYEIKNGTHNPFKEDFIKLVGKEFDERMTYMIKNQVELMAANTDLLNPVQDIIFEKEGVRFIHKFPNIHDSRFTDSNT